MKRCLIAFLILTMLITTCTTSFAEEFTFHKGLKFGMTREEVIKLEEENNDADFSVSEDKIWYYHDLVGVNTEDWLAADLSFTNRPFTGYFFFNRNTLSSAVFLKDFDDRSLYDGNVVALIEKYGDSISSETGYKELPSSSINAIDFFNMQYTLLSHWDLKKYSVEEANQWLNQVEGGYVQIFALLIIYRTGNNDRYYTIFSYDFISEKSYSDFIDTQDEEKQKDIESRDSDL